MLRKKMVFSWNFEKILIGLDNADFFTRPKIS